MKRQDLISRIKVQLKSLITPETQTFAEAKAGDLLLTTPAESFEVGAEIFYVDADGNNAPLNEGEYTLDNGVKIMVSGGKVSGIFEPEMETEPAEMVKEDKPMTEDVKEEKMESGIDMVEYEGMKTRLAKCEEMIMELMKNKDMMEKKMSEFAALPSETPIKSQPVENKPIGLKKEFASQPDIMDIRERARRNRNKI